MLSRPIVAPFGGRDARFGTNPFCVGVPRAGRRADRARLRDQPHRAGQDAGGLQQGRAVEPGTLIDDQGNPTTDPRYTVVEPFGALLTFGEHKGSGLALVCELLGGALTGGATAASACRRRGAGC